MHIKRLSAAKPRSSTAADALLPLLSRLGVVRVFSHRLSTTHLECVPQRMDGLFALLLDAFGSGTQGATA